MPVTNQ